MKIAITADVHLTREKDHPERYNALKNILEKITREGIDTLIIAGDLFDKTYRNYAEFDKIATEYDHINFHIIPGNHDKMLDKKAIASENVEIYSSPSVERLDDTDLLFFFVPYRKDATMGEIIASKKDELPENEWILIGHGDWGTRITEFNPLEPGVYMPLSQKDIELFRPLQVFLGHIHQPTDEEFVCYPGSPCGLDVTETGKRRFVIFDTETIDIESEGVDTDIIYFSENIVILPLEDEETYLRNKIKEIIKDWGIEEEDKPKVIVRIKVKGYTRDIRKLKQVVKEEFKDFRFYNEEDVDVSEVFLSENYELEEIAMMVAEKIREINWPQELLQPTYDEILFHALKVIYGGK